MNAKNMVLLNRLRGNPFRNAIGCALFPRWSERYIKYERLLFAAVERITNAEEINRNVLVYCLLQ